MFHPRQHDLLCLGPPLTNFSGSWRPPAWRNKWPIFWLSPNQKFGPERSILEGKNTTITLSTLKNFKTRSFRKFEARNFYQTSFRLICGNFAPFFLQKYFCAAIKFFRKFAAKLRQMCQSKLWGSRVSFQSTKSSESNYTRRDTSKFLILLTCAEGLQKYKILTFKSIRYLK